MKLAARLHDVERTWTTPRGAALVEALLVTDDADTATSVRLPEGEGIVLRGPRDVVETIAEALVADGVRVYAAHRGDWTPWTPDCIDRDTGGEGGGRS